MTHCRALRLLRVMARSGSLEERAVARVSMDEILERRFALSRRTRKVVVG